MPAVGESKKELVEPQEVVTIDEDDDEIQVIYVKRAPDVVYQGKSSRGRGEFRDVEMRDHSAERPLLPRSRVHTQSRAVRSLIDVSGGRVERRIELHANRVDLMSPVRGGEKERQETKTLTRMRPRSPEGRQIKRTMNSPLTPRVPVRQHRVHSANWNESEEDEMEREKEVKRVEKERKRRIEEENERIKKIEEEEERVARLKAKKSERKSNFFDLSDDSKELEKKHFNNRSKGGSRHSQKAYETSHDFAAAAYANYGMDYLFSGEETLTRLRPRSHMKSMMNSPLTPRVPVRQHRVHLAKKSVANWNESEEEMDREKERKRIEEENERIKKIEEEEERVARLKAKKSGRMSRMSHIFDLSDDSEMEEWEKKHFDYVRRSVSPRSQHSYETSPDFAAATYANYRVADMDSGDELPQMLARIRHTLAFDPDLTGDDNGEAEEEGEEREKKRMEMMKRQTQNPVRGGEKERQGTRAKKSVANWNESEEDEMEREKEEKRIEKERKRRTRRTNEENERSKKIKEEEERVARLKDEERRRGEEREKRDRKKKEREEREKKKEEREREEKEKRMREEEEKKMKTPVLKKNPRANASMNDSQNSYVMSPVFVPATGRNHAVDMESGDELPPFLACVRDILEFDPDASLDDSIEAATREGNQRRRRRHAKKYVFDSSTGLNCVNQGDENKSRKKIPEWACHSYLTRTLELVRESPPLDPGVFFGPIIEPDLNLIFGPSSRYPRRTSSAMYDSPMSNPTKGKS